MRKITVYKWFLIFLLAAPYWVFADSLTFTPSTSQFGANTDPSVVSVVSGTHAWNCFNVAGNHLGGGGGQFGSGSGAWSTFLTGNNIDVDAGAAGTFKCLLNDYNNGSQVLCSGNTATVSSCLGSPSYASLEVDYVLTSSSGPVTPPVWNFSTTTTLVDDPDSQLFHMFLLFFMGMAFMIWLNRK